MAYNKWFVHHGNISLMKFGDFSDTFFLDTCKTKFQAQTQSNACESSASRSPPQFLIITGVTRWKNASQKINYTAGYEIKFEVRCNSIYYNSIHKNINP